MNVKYCSIMRIFVQMSQTQISASLLSADFLHLEKDIKAAEAAGVHWFHLDVMDAHLAPNISFGPPIISHIRKATKLPLDVHLMMNEPGLYLEDYFKLDVQRILIHVESYDINPSDVSQIRSVPRSSRQFDESRLIRDLQKIQNQGISAGITINPNTKLSDISQEVLDICDCYLVMSVNPGFSGQKFIPDVLDKVRKLRQQSDKDILVDGGVNNETAGLCRDAGANILISASYLFSSSDYKSAVSSLLN